MVTIPFRGESRPQARPRGGVRLAGGGDVPTVNPSVARDPGLQTSPAQFGALEAQSLQSTAQALSNVSEAAQRLAQKQQKLTDATFVNEQLIAIDRDLAERFEEHQSTADPTAPDFVSKFDEIANSIIERRVQGDGSDLVTEEATQSLRFRAERSRLGMFEQAVRVSRAARSDKAADVLEQRSNVISNRVRRDPSSLDAAFDEIETTVNDFGNSLTDNGRRDVLAAARLGAIESAVGGLAEQGRFAEAQALLSAERFDAELPPATRDRLQNVVKRAQAFDRAEVRALVNDHIASLQTTGQGIAGLRERARTSLEPRQFREFVRSEGLARDFFGASQKMQFAPVGEAVDTLEAFKPKPGTTDFADRTRLFGQLQTEARRIMTERRDDPMAAAIRAPEMQEVVQAAQDGDPGASQRFVQAGLALQARMGVPKVNRRVLTQAQAQQMVTGIQSAGAADRPGEILRLREQYGEFFPDVLRDLSDKGFNGIGLDPRTATLASVAGNPALSQTLAQVVETGSKELRDGVDNTVVRDVEAAVSDELSDWIRTVELGDFRGGRAAQVNGIRSVVEDVAVQFVRQGESAAAAAKRAADQVINDRFTVQDTYYVPKTDAAGQPYSTSAIDGFLRRQQTRDALEKSNIMTLAPLGREPTDLDRERTLRTAENSGFWVTNEDGTGVFLMVQDTAGARIPVFKEDGTRYEFTFRRASDAGVPPLTVPDDAAGVEGVGG